MAVYMSRDAKLYVTLETTGSTWQVPILDGFSFSQASESSDITLTEANSSAGTSRRGKKTFNTGLAAAEFSFSTYVRPFKTAGSGTVGHASDTANNVHGVEEVLWAMFAGANGHTDTTGVFDYEANAATVSTQVNDTSNTFNFSQSNQPVFNTGATLEFFIPNGGEGTSTEDTLYTLNNAVINEATIDFDIEGIAQISWSGMAQSITTAAAATEPTPTIYEGVTETSAFIQNRLSKVGITAGNATVFPGKGGASPGVYDITLTGGSVTFTNNISSLMPEEMGIVNQSVGLITGTREVSGSLTCYLNSGTGGSRDFFKAFQEATALAIPTNSFALTLQIGGTTGTRLEIPMPTAMFELPTLAIDDVVGVEANFFGLSSNIETTDEATIVYKV
jgi:hypothetical protein